jgi:16S rRNA (uracil1498-N3)-methyltransferase
VHRFFVPPSSIQGNQVEVTGQQAHQITRVLRMRPGNTIVVLDNSGWEIETEVVSLDHAVVRGRVVRRRLAQSEPRTKISLYQAVLKGGSFEYALQKGTELGIVEFVPVIASRCIMSDLEAVEKKRGRWEAIIQEAAEQSHRGRKPVLRPAAFFSQVCEKVMHTGGLALLLWTGEKRTAIGDLLRKPQPGRSAGQRPFAVSLLVGPEGGFTLEEISIARSYGLGTAGMGPRVLRSETAGVAAAAVVLYELGDMQ